MNLSKLTAYLAGSLLLWGGFSLWAISVLERALQMLQVISTGFVIIGGFNWIGYSVYLMRCVLPEVDAIVYLEQHERRQTDGDNFFLRVMRLLEYAGASNCRWCNRRHTKHYDFRQLPDNLRLPLAVHSYWMWLGALAMCISYAATKLLEH